MENYVKKSVKSTIVLFAALSTAVIGITGFKTDVKAADYNASFSGETTNVSKVEVDEGNKVYEDTDVSGTLTYSFNQSDMLDEINGLLEIAQSYLGGAYTILDNNNYVDVTVTLPEGFSGTYEDASTATIVNTKLISNTYNVFVVRVFITGGKDPTVRTVKETVESYKTEPRDAVVAFKINYTGKAKEGTDSSQYVSSVTPSERNIGYGRWISASVGLTGSNVNLLTTEFVPGIPTGENVFTEGDILIGDDTEHDKVFEAKAGGVYSFTGTYTTIPVKKELSRIANTNANQLDKEQIKLSDLRSEFYASMTLPEGMEFTKIPTPDEVKFEGGASTFSVSNVQVVGDTIEVIMSLNTDNITNFYQLEQAVYACDDVLKITVPGIKLSDNAKEGEYYTVKGASGGMFHSVASMNNRQGVFEFEWEAKQSDEGRDFISPEGDEGIFFTLQVKNNNENETVPDNENNKTEDKDNSGGTTQENKNDIKLIKSNEAVKNTVKTGDNSNIVLWISIIAAASCVTILSSVYMIKRKNKN